MNLASSIYKHPIQGYTRGSPEDLYQQYLTTKGFELVIQQLKRHSPINLIEINKSFSTGYIQSGYVVLTTTIEDCQCTDFKSIKLPCRHIFAVRKFFNLTLF